MESTKRRAHRFRERSKNEKFARPVSSLVEYNEEKDSSTEPSCTPWRSTARMDGCLLRRCIPSHHTDGRRREEATGAEDRSGK
ncbi:unnamed protein product [Litomosoides sigmodontis]|uniref:Uncharacterized protein n=1 Tax=Litomosoides sigmodontis TaxID=42156 RepID=A0A3P7JKI6_LITSI|nr:unnamed protein product [Litomosoides sigmodontis]